MNAGLPDPPVEITDPIDINLVITAFEQATPFGGPIPDWTTDALGYRGIRIDVGDAIENLPQAFFIYEGILGVTDDAGAMQLFADDGQLEDVLLEMVLPEP